MPAMVSSIFSNYQRVRTSDISDDHGSDPSEGNLEKLSDKRSYSGIGTWPLLVCILCTAFNFILANTYLHALPPPPKSPITRREMHLLRRPSQYIRLDEIARPSPPEPKQFNNYPISITQIDSADMDKVFGNDAYTHMVHSGTITPEDRRVHASNTISTIVQFRAIDWGMETCELQVVLPAAAAVTMSEMPFVLDVFRLNATTPIDTSISSRTRPPRISKVAVIELGHPSDVHWHRNFACASDDLLTFELVCVPAPGEKDCYVEWWQNKEDPMFSERAMTLERPLPGTLF